MRSFQQVVVFLFATLFAFALAQEEPASYDATVYVTSTVYRVNTVTLSGTPTGSVVNVTSTIPASHYGTGYPSHPSHPSNGTTAGLYPSGSSTPSVSAPPADFTGAASQMNANVLLAALAAGIGYLAL